MNFKYITPVVLSTLFSVSAYAQDFTLPCDDQIQQAGEDAVQKLSAFTPAKIIERPPANYPKEAARSGREGWVQMSYVIDTEGNVQDIVIEDDFGGKEFRRAAKRAISRWQFEPAMKDGKPTQQCHQAVQYDFNIEGPRGATRRFIREYREVEELVNQGDFATAEQKLNELRNLSSLNRYENAFLWGMDAQLAAKLQDTERERKSLYRTLRSSNSHSADYATFGSEYIAYVYQRLFILNANRNFLADALSVANDLANYAGGEKRYAQIADSVQLVKDYVASNEVIGIQLAIEDDGNVFHELVRDQFSFSSIEGELNHVEVRCETRREIFTVAEEHIWDIPDSWGQCRVLVQGAPNSTFTLLEV